MLSSNFCLVRIPLLERVISLDGATRRYREAAVRAVSVDPPWHLLGLHVQGPLEHCTLE